MTTRRMVKASLALSVALLASIVPASALAWTQEINEYDNGGTYMCGTKQSEPCLYWQEPHYTSITIHAYEDPSLKTLNGLGGSYDMTATLPNVFNDFNAVPYYFPYLYQCSNNTSGCGPITYNTGVLNCGTLAQTAYGSYSTPKNNGEWYAFFPTGGNSRQVTFNTTVTWNHSLYDQFWTCTNNNADGQEVADHETGHIMSLGHTGYTTAIMYPYVQGKYDTLQSNDKAGLAAIYPGNQPSS